MKSLFQYSNGTIAAIIIGGSFVIGITLCLGICGFLHSVDRKKRLSRRKSSSSSVSNQFSRNGIFKEQSQSVLRGDHPIAFVLPSVSMSETGSEISEFESTTASQTMSTSPSLSLTSPSRSNPPWRRLRNQSNPLHTIHYPAHQTNASYNHSRRKSPSSSSHSRRRQYSPLIPEHSAAENEENLEIGAKFQNYNSTVATSYSALNFNTKELGARPKTMARSKSETTSPRSIREKEENQMSRSLPPASTLGPFLVPPMDLSQNQFQRTQTLYQEEDLEQSNNPILGKVSLKLEVSQDNLLMIKEIFISELNRPAMSSKMERIHIRIKIYPESRICYESGLLSIFEDNVLLLDAVDIMTQNIEIPYPLVIKISAFDGSNEEELSKRNNKKNLVGHSIFNLELILPMRESSVEIRAPLKRNVITELNEIFSDQIEISLCYEKEFGKLTLGLTRAKLSGIAIVDFPHIAEGSLYTKVTLFEGRKVIKAKKTRPVGYCNHPQFDETFSILFPESFLDRVSCVISLCSRSRQGLKTVLGRFPVGPAGFSDSRGIQHWNRMVQNSGATIIQWHSFRN